MDSETKKGVILFIQLIHFTWLMVQRSNANLVTLKNGIKWEKNYKNCISHPIFKFEPIMDSVGDLAMKYAISSDPISQISHL